MIGQGQEESGGRRQQHPSPHSCPRQWNYSHRILCLSWAPGRDSNPSGQPSPLDCEATRPGAPCKGTVRCSATWPRLRVCQDGAAWMRTERATGGSDVPTGSAAGCLWRESRGRCSASRLTEGAAPMSSRDSPETCCAALAWTLSPSSTRNPTGVRLESERQLSRSGRSFCCDNSTELRRDAATDLQDSRDTFPGGRAQSRHKAPPPRAMRITSTPARLGL